MWILCKHGLILLFLLVAMTACAQEADEEIDFTELPQEKLLAFAEDGNAEAQFEMGQRLIMSAEPDEDGAFIVDPGMKDEALIWYEKSAKNGYAEAYNMLGSYHDVWADFPDPEKARGVWEKAIALGSWTAKLNYGNKFYADDQYGEQAYQYLLDVESEAELQEHEKFQSVWHQSLFNIYSFKYAGQDYQPKKAMEHGKKCAYGTNSIAECQFLLARYLDNGWADETNNEEADKLFLAAAERGHSASQWYTGMNYLNGEFFEKDEAKAYDWVRQAAEQEYMDGMISFAVMNATGEGTGINPEAAFQWYEKAAMLGSHHALRGLSYMHLNGEGVPKNIELAVAGLIIASKEDENAEKLLVDGFENYNDNKAAIAEEYKEKILEVKQTYGFD